MERLLLAWFGSKRFERHGAAYERLGVHRFKRFLPFGYWMNRLIRGLGARGFRVVRDEQGAKAWVLFTVVAEFGHTVAFGVFFAFMVADLLDGNYVEAAGVAAVNLLVNVYPVMVQRYNRIRILRGFRLDLKDLPRWDF